MWEVWVCVSRLFYPCFKSIKIPRQSFQFFLTFSFPCTHFFHSFDTGFPRSASIFIPFLPSLLFYLQTFLVTRTYLLNCLFSSFLIIGSWCHFPNKFIFHPAFLAIPIKKLHFPQTDLWVKSFSSFPKIHMHTSS